MWIRDAHAQRRRAESMGWQQHCKQFCCSHGCRHCRALSALAATGLMDELQRAGCQYCSASWLHARVELLASVLHDASDSALQKNFTVQRSTRKAKQSASRVIYSSCRRCTPVHSAAARANKFDAVAALMLGKPATEADILNRWSNPAERLKTVASASLLFAAAFLVIYALARLLEAVFERFQRRKQR